MSDDPRWMIYGANGFTGRRIAEEAVARGHRPILAGRNRDAVVFLAESLHCPYRIFSLDAPDDPAAAVAGLRLVLHCAGPFSRTARPMMEACLETHTHYLDITGEIDVFEHAASLDAKAKERRVTLLPGVGFDVVPSDCLAAKLAGRIAQPTDLVLAFTGIGMVSTGTARTVWEILPKGGMIRRDGKLKRVPLTYRVREIPFPEGPRTAVTIPWGDVATAWYTTGIPNIEVYLAMPPKTLKVMRWAAPLLSLGKVMPSNPMIETALRNLLSRPHPGAMPQQKAGAEGGLINGARSEFWGEVRNEAGDVASAAIVTPDGYALTVLTALASVERVLTESLPFGFTTPARAFGPDFIDAMPGVVVCDSVVAV